MNCEWVRENIVLQVYNELEDDARHELEQHVARCADCAAELKSAKEFHAALAQAPMREPSPNLLAASRMRFQEALETAEQGGLWRRPRVGDIVRRLFLARPRAAPGGEVGGANRPAAHHSTCSEHTASLAEPG